MQKTASVLFTILIIVCLFTSTFADDFTAVKTGNWKDPATWGFSGYARDLNIPGIMDGRLDSATIPEGITVFYEGGMTPAAKLLGRTPFGIPETEWGDKKKTTKLDTLRINGEVKGRSSTKKIKIKGQFIEIGPNGNIGGSNTSKPKNAVHIEADSTITIKGKVYGKGSSSNDDSDGRVKIIAGGDIVIAGNPPPGDTVVSVKKRVDIASSRGNVNIGENGVVRAKKSVRINAGPGKNIVIEGRVQSHDNNVHINGGKKSNPPGNVVVGSTGVVKAGSPKGEVYIKADTLRVFGQIIGNTVQKNCNVVIIEKGGSIKGDISGKNKITRDLNVKKRENPAEPAEKAKEKDVFGDDVFTADFSGAEGIVLEADDRVRVAGGAGSTLDLTNNPAGTPIISCPGDIQVYFDNILLDPGVILEDLCGPGPVTWGPPQPMVSVACLSYGDTTGYPGFPGEVQFMVTNMGNVPEVFEFMWEDSLGWGPVPAFPPILLGGATDPWDTLLTMPFDVPPWAIPEADTNSLRLTVTSTTSPWEDYTENILLPVADIAELKDVNIALWGVNPAPGGSVMSIEHWISNDGELDDDYLLSVTNLAGWPVLPFDPNLFLPSEEDILFMSEMEIPPGTPDGIPNEVYIMAESMTSPGVAFIDTVQILVNVVAAVDPDLPRAGAIRHSCFPNPFNPKVVISFTAPDPDGEVTVVVYDINGRRIKTLHEGIMNGTGGELSWNGTDSVGRPVASGVYFYRITAGGQMAAGKMILAK